MLTFRGFTPHAAEIKHRPMINHRFHLRLTAFLEKLSEPVSNVDVFFRLPVLSDETCFPFSLEIPAQGVSLKEEHIQCNKADCGFSYLCEYAIFASFDQSGQKPATQRVHAKVQLAGGRNPPEGPESHEVDPRDGQANGHGKQWRDSD